MPRPFVYTYFDSSDHADPAQGSMLKLWARSWAARGWSPRILTVRNAARHAQYPRLKNDPRELPRMAAESAGVKWLCPSTALNFSFTPAKHRKSGIPIIYHFHSNGWEGASLVDFPNIFDVSVIENCGRPL